MKEFLDGLDFRPGATRAVIAETEKSLGVRLPAEYIEFLEFTNGGEGFVGEHAYAMFWDVEKLALLNSAYEVQRYAPGLLLFGSDGGGEAYGFDMRASPWQIVRIPFVGMSWELARPLGGTFGEFLHSLYEV